MRDIAGAAEQRLQQTELTAFDGTNEMRWQIASLNATETNTTEDGLFFEVTEEELYGTGVSANFFEQSPAESCRESSMLTYGLVAIPFCVCGGFCIMGGVCASNGILNQDAEASGGCKPKPTYGMLYVVFKVRHLVGPTH